MPAVQMQPNPEPAGITAILHSLAQTQSEVARYAASGQHLSQYDVQRLRAELSGLSSQCTLLPGAPASLLQGGPGSVAMAGGAAGLGYAQSEPADDGGGVCPKCFRPY